MTDHTDQRKPWLPLGVALFISGVVVAAAFNPAPHNGGDNAAYVTLAFSLAEHQKTAVVNPIPDIYVKAVRLGLVKKGYVGMT